MFGDSAYMDDDYLLTGGGREMSSARESVEWEYCDVKSQWKKFFILKIQSLLL